MKYLFNLTLIYFLIRILQNKNEILINEFTGLVQPLIEDPDNNIFKTMQLKPNILFENSEIHNLFRLYSQNKILFQRTCQLLKDIKHSEQLKPYVQNWGYNVVIILNICDIFDIQMRKENVKIFISTQLLKNEIQIDVKLVVIIFLLEIKEDKLDQFLNFASQYQYKSVQYCDLIKKMCQFTLNNNFLQERSIIEKQCQNQTQPFIYGFDYALRNYTGINQLKKKRVVI